MSFAARHPGPCMGDCGGRIATGDQIEQCDDGWQHLACAEVERGQTALLEGNRSHMCPDCFTIHAGECL